MSNYWTSILYKKLLKCYLRGRIKLKGHIKSASYPFLWQVCKETFHASAPKLHGYQINLDAKRAKLLAPTFILPSIKDIARLELPVGENNNATPEKFVMFRPLNSFDFSTTPSTTNFFYLKKNFIFFHNFVRTEILAYLRRWVLLQEVFVCEGLIFLFERERQLLDSLVRRPLRLPAVAVARIKPKQTHVTHKKLNSARARIETDTMKFLIKLTRISSRAGRRLGNFKHFTIFLTKLRKIGGLRRLTQIIKILNPFFYFRKRYRGRKSFVVPLIVMPNSKHKFISRNLLNAALRRTTERWFFDRLFMEVYDTLRRRGRAYKYKRSILNLVNLHKFNIKRRYFRRLFRRKAFY